MFVFVFLVVYSLLCVFHSFCVSHSFCFVSFLDLKRPDS
jgi:hypothetical protein